MKELIIEEKAKAYDEAIERAKVFKEHLLEINEKDYADEMDYIFPELKESEDERIRKDMMETIEKESKDFPSSVIAEKSHTWIAWLEKQGKQKLVQETEPTPIFKIGDILKRKGKDYTFRVDRIQGGYYHCDRNHGAFFPIEEQGLWQLVEQNPAWSEEDEQYITDTLNLLSFGCSIHSISEVQDFLLSLKNRYTWKPSSELDEASYQVGIKRVLENPESYGLTKYNWKPSDEQMERLKGAINSLPHQEVLYSLYQDLKKLREE